MMKCVVEMQRNIDVILEADVVVVGGGPAGIGAALAAARNGAQTVLVERFGSLGGMQTHGLNPLFAFVDPALHSGLVLELIERLEAEQAISDMSALPVEERARLKATLLKLAGPEKLPKRLVETEAGYWGRWGYIFDIEYYKYLLDTLMREAGVRVFFHTFAAAALGEDNLLSGVVIENREGRKAILARVVIDTTGDGNLAWKSGATCLGAEGLPAGPHKGERGLGLLSSFFMGGVDHDRFLAYKREHKEEWGELYVGQKMLKEARAAGYYVLDRVEKIILSERHDIYGSDKMWLMTLLYAVKGSNPFNTSELSNGEMELRKQAHALLKILKAYVPGFENAYVDRTANAPLLGGGYSLRGDHVITVGEMREGKAFDDSIAISNMPPDLYEVAGRFGYEILPHDIPYRCIVSRDVDNLMAAGTTISSGMFAGAALRYCTPSICTGYAAGTAAALAAGNKVTPKALDVKMLQATLRNAGARVSVREVSDEALAPYRFIQNLGIVFRRTEKEIISEDEIALH